MDNVLPFPAASSRTTRIYHAWLLPVFGFVLGLACAYLVFYGLFETWRLAGSPGEKIVRIAGLQEGRAVLVETGTGGLYSLEFDQGEGVVLPAQTEWKPVLPGTVDPEPRGEGDARFFAWPPLFPVQQVLEWEYVYRVEGAGLVKFALAPDGNLWMWVHQNAGLAGLVFYFYPVMGMTAGLAAMGLVWIIRRAYPKSI